MSQSLGDFIWKDEWYKILKKSFEIQSKGGIFSTWFYPVHNFLLFDINPIFENNVNFLSLAPFDFVYNAVLWLAHPIIRNTNLLQEIKEKEGQKHKPEEIKRISEIHFCKKLLIVLIFHNLFSYGSIDADVFAKIGDDDGNLIVIASSWPVELHDQFLYMNIYCLSQEKNQFLKSYIWYFLRLYYKNLCLKDPETIVPLYVTEKFPGLLLDKIPNDF
jgi:hypothetical protein